MLLELQQLNSIEIKIENEILESSNEYDFFSCQCNHIHYTSPCQFGMRKNVCGCMKIISKKFNLVINISILDIFYFENSELVFDSPDFWFEYKSWIKNYAK